MAPHRAPAVWSTFVPPAGPGTGAAARLVLFHSRYKLLLMAHSPAGLRALGQLVAGVGRTTATRVYDEYFARLAIVLAMPVTVGGHVNALQHAAGYLKRLVTADERGEIAAAIDAFAKGTAPLAAPVRLIRGLAQAHHVDYLLDQVYLEAAPEDATRA